MATTPGGPSVTRVGVGEGRASSAKSGGGWVPADDSSPDWRSLTMIITIISNKPGGVDKISPSMT